jgi:hypothetical protein
MEWDGKITAPDLVCSVTGRRLLPGEAFFSGLVLANGGFSRAVFSAEAWPVQDHDLFVSWWRQRVPEASKDGRTLRLDADSLDQLFANLRESRTRTEQCLAYVVALALVRAKKLTFQTIATVDGVAWMVAEDRKRGIAHRIRDPGMSEAEQQQVLEALLAATGAA